MTKRFAIKKNHNESELRNDGNIYILGVRCGSTGKFIGERERDVMIGGVTGYLLSNC